MEGELQSFAASVLSELCEKHPLGYTPKLVWKQLRVTAGTAHYRAGMITLSSIVLCDSERLNITLKHEYAHLMAYVRHGKKGAGHGVHWRSAMVELGLEPKVRHKYDVQRNVARQEVAYACQRCGATLLRKRRLPSRRKYVHAKCGGALKLHYVRPATVGESTA